MSTQNVLQDEPEVGFDVVNRDAEPAARVKCAVA